MKYRLMDVLHCPECGEDLDVHVYRSQANACEIEEKPGAYCRRICARSNVPASEVAASDCVECHREELIEGKLSCRGCDAVFPLINGVPRLLPRSMLAESVTAYHGEFLERHGEDFPGITGDQAAASGRKVDTLHAFSYQWTTFVDNFAYFRSIYLSFVQPFLQASDFDGRSVLELGCGSGRPASVASSFGAEVFATDLSEAVETAHAASATYPHLHVVQSDIYRLPFRPMFDFVYSVGVIQHLPDPPAAMRSITKVVAPGSRLVIWVYGVRELWYQPIDWLRKLTVRMPFRVLHGLSIVLAVLSEIVLLVPYRILSRIPFTRELAERIPGRIYAKFPFRENVVGWFDRLGAPVTHYFTRDDVEKMLADAEFEAIEVVARPGASASWVAQAIRKGLDANRKDEP